MFVKLRAFNPAAVRLEYPTNVPAPSQKFASDADGRIARTRCAGSRKLPGLHENNMPHLRPIPCCSRYVSQKSHQKTSGIDPSGSDRLRPVAVAPHPRTTLPCGGRFALSPERPAVSARVSAAAGDRAWGTDVVVLHACKTGGHHDPSSLHRRTRPEAGRSG